MYARRTKKAFPPGTFIPTPIRIAAVIQLCLAFTILAWNASKPFMEELFSLKSHLFLYQNVMGIETHIKKPSDLQRIKRNANRFNELSEDQKTSIIERYKQLQEASEKSFWAKFTRSLHVLALGIPPFEQAWIIFSIAISILLLKKTEGIVQAVWILPLLAFLFAIDNRWSGISPTADEEAAIFPSERIIVEKYLKHPLSSNFVQQREELMLGWKIYLIEEWAHEVPLKEVAAFEQQVERGEFAFNKARLNALPSYQHDSLYPYLFHKKSILILSLYIFWNILFALMTQKHLKHLSAAGCN